MRTPSAWYVLLLIVCMLGPYLLGVPPRTGRDWFCLGLTIGFLTWLLAGFVSLGSI